MSINVSLYYYGMHGAVRFNHKIQWVCVFIFYKLLKILMGDYYQIACFNHFQFIIAILKINW